MSHLVGVDEEAVRLRLRVDDSASGLLSLQELLEFTPLVLKRGADGRSVQLGGDTRTREPEYTGPGEGGGGTPVQ